MKIDLENSEMVEEIVNIFVRYSNLRELYIEHLSTGNYLGMKKPERFEEALQPLPARSYDGLTEKNDHRKLAEVKSSVVGTITLERRDQSEKIRKGDLVTEHQLLGTILHLGNLLEEIESPCPGQIAEIFVEDGSSVDYGQLLFKITVQSAQEATQPP